MEKQHPVAAENKSKMKQYKLIISAVFLVLTALSFACYFIAPGSQWYEKPVPVELQPKVPVMENPLLNAKHEEEAEPEPVQSEQPKKEAPKTDPKAWKEGLPGIAFIGDSIMAGYGCSKDLDPSKDEKCPNSAANIEADLIGYEHYNFENLSLGAEQSQAYDAAMDANYLKTYITDKKIKYVQIMLGTNDALAGGVTKLWTKDNYRTALSEMIRKLESAGVQKIIIHRPTYIIGQNRENTRASNDNISLDEYLLVMDDIANQDPAVFMGDTAAADWFANVGANGDNYDIYGIHPNAKGHEILGKFWYDAFKRVLGAEYEGK
ncbi:MAG: SGNH/GDSL hydrolase family protein [Candidatus Ancillula sp.]|jgi:lysophospholipase L1-like esterase|nr:SGNH/GDSL hydrolase family protein [Candidatus Ancillula sp.]